MQYDQRTCHCRRRHHRTVPPMDTGVPLSTCHPPPCTIRHYPDAASALSSCAHEPALPFASSSIRDDRGLVLYAIPAGTDSIIERICKRRKQNCIGVSLRHQQQGNTISLYNKASLIGRQNLLCGWRSSTNGRAPSCLRRGQRWLHRDLRTQEKKGLAQEAEGYVAVLLLNPPPFAPLTDVHDDDIPLLDLSCQDALGKAVLDEAHDGAAQRAGAVAGVEAVLHQPESVESCRCGSGSRVVR